VNSHRKPLTQGIQNIIVAGSGSDVQDVNKLVKQFRDAPKLMKPLQKTGGRGLGNLFG
jgi:signal recognition particle subunit SRP54